mmetsp:Transcript_29485/g.80949  ORF Transcript_29485/g.80949 Transcript_29485/m.80949 type:complete len:109 (-) Transcript_29485:460-786(-)
MGKQGANLAISGKHVRREKLPKGSNEVHIRSLRVTVRMMRVFHAPSAHFSCTAAEADTACSLGRIKDTKQGMAELIHFAPVVPRGGARWEIREPLVACVADLRLVIEM